MGSGVIAFRIEDNSGAPLESLANVPQIEWVQGVPTASAMSLPQHQVYSCGAEAGGTLRVFGRNLGAITHILLTRSNGAQFSLTASEQDANSLAAAVPSSLVAGTYTLWVGYSNQQDATASQSVRVVIHSASNSKAFNMSCPNVIGDGKTDNTRAFQICFDRNQSSSPNTLIYFALPAGNYLISSSLTLHSYQYIVGVSPAATIITGAQTPHHPTSWISGSNNFGLLHLTVKAAIFETVIQSSFTSWYLPASTSGHILLYNVNIVPVQYPTPSLYSSGNPWLVHVGGPDIRIVNSVIDSRTFSSHLVTLYLAGATGALVSGNTLFHGVESYYSIGTAQDVIIEHNIVQGGGQLPGGAGLQLAADTAGGNVDAGLTQNIYFGYNNSSNLLEDDNGAQGLSTDGGAGSYFGKLASSSSSGIVLANAANWNFLGNAVPQHALVSIIAGTGLGQFRTLQSIDGHSIQVTTPWDVAPDETSVVTITAYERYVIISHNQMTNVSGPAIQFFGKVYDSVVENNQLNNTGDGISVRSTGPYFTGGYLSTFDNEVLNNTLSGVAPYPAKDGSYGISIFSQGPGNGISGLLVRGNTVFAPQAILLSNDPTSTLQNVSAVLVEDNQASLSPWTDTVVATLPLLLFNNNHP